jgi:hypothetical protein
MCKIGVISAALAISDLSVDIQVEQCDQTFGTKKIAPYCPKIAQNCALAKNLVENHNCPKNTFIYHQIHVLTM